MKHYLKVGGNSRATEQYIILNVDCDSTYVNVCWLGVITNEEACFGDDVQTYCESIYIGVNTSCSEEKEVNGTITWYDCIITYKIIQSKRTDCEDCGSNTSTCELIDAYVGPYYVSTDTTATTVYYQYWKTTKNECEVISRVIENDSQKVNIVTSGVACNSDDRAISVPPINYCGGRIEGLSCYVQKPDNCCDYEDGDTCYEINDIFYVPQKVDASGGTVEFFCDYKKTTYKNCKKTYSYGRFQDTVNVSGCTDKECCKERIKNITYTWSGHTLCSGGSDISLTIPQKRDLTYTGDCACNVTPDKGYCVDVHSIKRYHKLGNGTWEEIRPLDPNSYKFPYYGGTMKVSWEYSAITVGDDCHIDISSGNTWEDYIEILPYDGDICGGINYSAIQYVFKKSPCAFEKDTKSILPPNICNENCINEFNIEYEQYRNPCSDICESCLSKFYVELDSGGTVTSSDTATCDITLINDTKPSWLTVTVNGRNVSYSAPLNSGSTREGGVTFKLKNQECYDTVIITQSGSSEDIDPSPVDPEIICNCENAFFEAYSAQTALSKNGGEHTFIGSYIFNDCIKDVSTASDYSISYDEELTCSGGDVTFTATKGESSFVSNVSFENGAIYADIEENETSEERTYELPISYTVENCGDKETSIIVKQKKGSDQVLGMGPEPDPCEGWTIVLNGGSSQYFYQDYEGSGGTPVNFFVKDGSSAIVGDLTTDDFEVIIDNDYQILFDGFEIQKADPAPQAPYLLYLNKTGIDTVCSHVGESISLELKLKDCQDVKTNVNVIIGEVDSWNVKIDGVKSDQNSLYFGFKAHVKVGNCDKFVHMGEIQATRRNPDDGNLYATLKVFRSIDWDDEIYIVLANSGGYCENPACAKITSYNFNDLLVHYCPDGTLFIKVLKIIYDRN